MLRSTTPRLSAILIGLCLAPGAECLAYRGGPPAGLTGSPASLGASCRQCHGSAAGVGSVQILDAPAAYAPGALYDFRVRIADPNRAGAGFEVSVEAAGGVHAGQIIITDELNTQFAEGFPPAQYASHTLDGVANAVADWAAMGSSAEYHLRWRAPMEDMGVITFYAAGNAINNNFANSGDIIYLTSVSAAFQPCAADLDADGAIGASDLALILGSWGQSSSAADLDHDGVVGASDLAIALGSWGPCA